MLRGGWAAGGGPGRRGMRRGGADAARVVAGSGGGAGAARRGMLRRQRLEEDHDDIGRHDADSGGDIGRRCDGDGWTRIAHGSGDGVDARRALNEQWRSALRAGGCDGEEGISLEYIG